MSEKNGVQAEIPRVAEIPDASYKQSVKLVLCAFFFVAVQMPLTMRNLFQIRRKPAELGH